MSTLIKRNGDWKKTAFVHAKQLNPFINAKPTIKENKTFSSQALPSGATDDYALIYTAEYDCFVLISLDITQSNGIIWIGDVNPYPSNLNVFPIAGNSFRNTSGTGSVNTAMSFIFLKKGTKIWQRKSNVAGTQSIKLSICEVA